MFKYFRRNKFLPTLVAILFCWLSVQTTVSASMISNSDIAAIEIAQIDRDALLNSLEREDVKQALIVRGVDPEQAKLRVASMTDEEINILKQKIDELPAGSGVVGAIVLIFLVLLATDLLGYTDVFPFVKKTIK